MKRLALLILALTLLLAMSQAARAEYVGPTEVTAGNTCTPWLDVVPGKVDMSIWPKTGWVATVTLKRDWNIQGMDPREPETFTSWYEGQVNAASGQRVRLCVQTGDHTSGTLYLFLAQD